MWHYRHLKNNKWLGFEKKEHRDPIMKCHLILFKWDRMPWDLWTHSRNCIASDALGREGILWRQSSPSPSPTPPPLFPGTHYIRVFFLIFSCFFAFCLIYACLFLFSYFSDCFSIIFLPCSNIPLNISYYILVYFFLFFVIFSHFLSNLEHHYLHYTCTYIQNIQIHVQRQFTRTHALKLQ